MRQGTIYIYGDIGTLDGQISLSGVQQQVEALGEIDSLIVRINSPGGSPFQAFGMVGFFDSLGIEIHTFIDGVALSAGSVVAMAGKTITIAENGLMMIHEGRADLGFSTADELTKASAMLSQVNSNIIDVYVNRTGRSREQVTQWVRDETWMSAEQALTNGFVTSIAKSKAVAAQYDLSRFLNSPAWAYQQVAAYCPVAAPTIAPVEIARVNAELLAIGDRVVAEATRDLEARPDLVKTLGIDPEAYIRRKVEMAGGLMRTEATTAPVVVSQTPEDVAAGAYFDSNPYLQHHLGCSRDEYIKIKADAAIMAKKAANPLVFCGQ